MQLPAALHKAVDDAVDGIPLADLQAASERLSRRYRSETRDGRAHLSDDLSARAYLAVRMPATYAAIHASLDAVAQLRPDFSPTSVLDVGAGPGTATFAACDLWPDLSSATLIEQSPAIRRWGETLLPRLALERTDWLAQDIATAALPQARHDLVILAYVLDELAPLVQAALVDRLWAGTGDMLVVVEPGTPAGWTRILSVRDRLIASGAHLVAPCPHAFACPLGAPDWCHFSRRVARSRMHRRIKAADVPWEDEKFIYLAASRREPLPVAARVIAPVQVRGGTVALTLCEQSGTARQHLLSKRDGDRFRQARRLAWGDCVGEHATMPSDSAV
ncbi:small ribosomal subunit Rsm22 family protein [Pseudorhodoplanes sp.]|uniref:small ribosomal subunit Rsm22 family protein n=1 Tax=Pseudorhodoplanes sp. TaxID=1934341 RepID=UPI003D1348EF